MSSLLLAALAYGERGWPVFPCVPKEKCPLTARGFKDATTDELAIREMWKRCPDANIGMVTGSHSGIVVLDADGVAGERSLDELQNTNGELPLTAESRTGRGGRHLLFLHPGKHVRNRTGFKPGLDVRGDGGYIVAPPSHTCKPYQWLRDPRETQLASVPDWLLDEIQQPSRPTGAKTGAKHVNVEEVVADPHRYADVVFACELASLAAAPIGQRNATLNNAAFALAPFVRDGLFGAEFVVTCLLESAVRKGLPALEAERTIASGLGTGIVKRRSPFVRGRLISQLPISARGKLLLRVLCDYANRDGWCWPSQRTLAHDCSWGSRAFTKALEEIMAFLEVRPMLGGHGRARHSYRLRWDVIQKVQGVFPTDSSFSFPKEQTLRMESCSALTVGAMAGIA